MFCWTCLGFCENHSHINWSETYCPLRQQVFFWLRFTCFWAIHIKLSYVSPLYYEVSGFILYWLGQLILMIILVLWTMLFGNLFIENAFNSFIIVPGLAIIFFFLCITPPILLFIFRPQPFCMHLLIFLGIILSILIIGWSLAFIISKCKSCFERIQSRRDEGEVK